MKRVLFLLLILFGISLTGYCQYFNTIENPLHSQCSAGALYKYKGNNYLVAGIIMDTAYHNWNRNILYVYDSAGNIKDIKYYGRYGEICFGGRDGGKTFLQLQDSSYIWAFTFLKGTPVKQYVKIMRFNQDLDTIWTKEILLNTDYHNIMGMVQTYDKGFALCGDISMGGYNSDVLLLKIDSLGNQKWINTYAVDSIDMAREIIELPDHSLVMYVTSNNQFDGSENPNLVKTDSAGSHLWTRTYGGNKSDLMGAICNSDSSNILLAFGYGYSNQPPYNCKIKLMKFDQHSGLIWEKFIDTIRMEAAVHKVTQNNNSIYICGNYYDLFDTADVYVSKIFKCDNNGNLINNKLYTKLMNSGSENYINNILFEKNGDIVMCGFIIDFYNIQSIWLLKTDSSGTQNALGIAETYDGALQVLKNYPNPATEFTTFTFAPLQANTRLEVFNMQGIKVFETRLQKQETNCILNLQNYAPGLYTVLLIQNNQKTGVGKVMKR